MQAVEGQLEGAFTASAGGIINITTACGQTQVQMAAAEDEESETEGPAPTVVSSASGSAGRNSGSIFSLGKKAGQDDDDDSELPFDLVCDTLFVIFLPETMVFGPCVVGMQNHLCPTLQVGVVRFLCQISMPDFYARLSILTWHTSTW